MYLRFLLQAFFLFLCLLCTVNNSHAEQPEAQPSDSHIVKVTSLLPPTVCNRNSTKVPSKASVEVVSRYGPCSYIKKGKMKTPNFKEILRKDQARVKYIQSRISELKHSGSDDDLLKQTDAITVGTKPELISNGIAGEFYITVSLGTPGQNVILSLDTGSDITWTKCPPCLDCFERKVPFFYPSKSSTYSAVPCGSSACLPEFGRVCDQNTCSFVGIYGSGSSNGLVATEKLTIMNGRSDTFVKYPYIFACSNNSSGDFGGISGLIGLDRSPASFISQTSQKYFSYCYPLSYSSPGYITFGKTDDEKKYKFVKFTPTPTISKHYYDIVVTGMAVVGTKLPIASSEYSKSGAIIDSGTTFTNLPPSVYAALRSAFRKKMSKYKKIGKIFQFDTCYDFSKYDEVAIPKISIFFKGGVEVELDVRGTMVVFEKDLSQVCLAFQAGSDKPSLILGNYQLGGIEVHHDFVGHRVGFGPGGCS